MDNWIDSYLVKIGYDFDSASEEAVNKGLNEVESKIKNHTDSIGKSLEKTQDLLTKSFVNLVGGSKETGAEFSSSLLLAEKYTAGFVKTLIGAQIAATGALFGVSAAVVDLVSSTADADLQMQIMSVRSLMSVQSTKAQTDALKELGLTYQDLAVSEQARAMFHHAVGIGQHEEEQYGFGEQNSPFEANMRRVREVQVAWAELKITAGNTVFAVASDLVDAMAPVMKGPLGYISENLEKWENNIPGVAKTITETLTPALKETFTILQSMWGDAQKGLLLFEHLAGLFSGDKELANAPLTFDNMGKAITHALDGVNNFLNAMGNVEDNLLHLVTAISDIMSGDYKDALGELKAALTKTTAGGGTIEGATAGVAAGALTGAGLGFAAAGGTPAAIVTVPIGAAIGAVIGGSGGAVGGHRFGTAMELRHEGKPWIRELISGQADWNNVDVPLAGLLNRHAGPAHASQPQEHANESQASIMGKILSLSHGSGLESLMLALGHSESDFNQKAVNGSHHGTFQLADATAKALGVNSLDADQNVSGAFKLVIHLMSKYHGDITKVVEAWHDGETQFDKGHISKEAIAEARNVQAYMTQQAPQIMQAAGDTTVHVTVTVANPNADPHEIGRQTANQTAAKLAQQKTDSRLNIAQMVNAHG